MSEFFEGIVKIASGLLTLAFWIGLFLIVLFVIFFIASLLGASFLTYMIS